MRTVRRQEANGKERVGAGRLDAAPKQANRGGKRGSGANEGRGGESMEQFTNDSIISAATSDQQDSYYSLRGGSLSSHGAWRGEARGGGGHERRDVDMGDHGQRRRDCGDGEGLMDAGLPLSASQEDESEMESSAMATMSSMPSGPAPPRKAGFSQTCSQEDESEMDKRMRVKWSSLQSSFQSDLRYIALLGFSSTEMQVVSCVCQRTSVIATQKRRMRLRQDCLSLSLSLYIYIYIHTTTK